MATHLTTHYRHRTSGFPIGSVLAAVVALHAVLAGGGLWLAKTQSGQQFARVYQIKQFEPPKPPEPGTQEPPSAPRPPTKVEPLPIDVAEAAALSAVRVATLAPAAAPTLGGGGTNGGGKFAGASSFDGPEGSFHVTVTRRFRDYYREPQEPFRAAELELSVAQDGAVLAYRLVRSSESANNDEAILGAASRVQTEGLGVTPPNDQAGIVTVRFTPSSS